MGSRSLGIGACYGLAAVAFGAFGKHLLAGVLAPDAREVYETAVRFQMYHALALLAVGLAARGRASKRLDWAGWLFTVGVALFSGSLYGLALSGVKALGAITPLGGVCLLAAWCLLAIEGFRTAER